MKRLVLMRGIPGSGKSTKAKQIACDHIMEHGGSVVICSTDDYHMENGEYVFKPDMLGQFHELNHQQAEAHMRNDVQLVIIDNTNVKRRDMKPYIDSANHFGYTVEEIIVGEDDLFPSLDDANPHTFADYIDLCARRNTHGVPRDAIERMARKFQK